MVHTLLLLLSFTHPIHFQVSHVFLFMSVWELESWNATYTLYVFLRRFHILFNVTQKKKKEVSLSRKFKIERKKLEVT